MAPGWKIKRLCNTGIDQGGRVRSELKRKQSDSVSKIKRGNNINGGLRLLFGS